MMNLINMDRTQGKLTNHTLKYYWTQGELTNLKPLKVNLLIKLTTIELFLNTNVCHHKKEGDCWNKMCLTLPL